MRRGKSARSDGRLYGEAPFGWRVSDDKGALLVDANEQRIRAVVRHMHLVARLPLREIVLQLEAMGIRNRRGKAFGLSRVWEMVHGGDELPPEAGARVATPRAPSRSSPRTYARR